MSDTTLTDAQKDAIRGWVKAGEGLSEIQRRIREEFNISMTYMDVRFLVIDLDVQLKDREHRETVDLSAARDQDAPGHAQAPGAGADAGAEDGGAPGAGTGSGVRVDLDRVTKAGAVVSGTVVFSDGVSAAWSLDQFGRLALDPGPGQETYNPSPEDIQTFQTELRDLLASRGF